VAVSTDLVVESPPFPISCITLLMASSADSGRVGDVSSPRRPFTDGPVLLDLWSPRLENPAFRLPWPGLHLPDDRQQTVCRKRKGGLDDRRGLIGGQAWQPIDRDV
jgi:hypothetical protein